MGVGTVHSLLRCYHMVSYHMVFVASSDSGQIHQTENWSLWKAAFNSLRAIRVCIYELGYPKWTWFIWCIQLLNQACSVASRIKWPWHIWSEIWEGSDSRNCMIRSLTHSAILPLWLDVTGAFRPFPLRAHFAFIKDSWSVLLLLGWCKTNCVFSVILTF